MSDPIVESQLQIVWFGENGLQSLSFDIVESMNHISESDISEFVLEDGSVISEHIISKNAVLTCSVSVSKYPHQRNPEIPMGGNSRRDSPGTEVGNEKQIKGHEELVELQAPYLKRTPPSDSSVGGGGHGDDRNGGGIFTGGGSRPPIRYPVFEPRLLRSLKILQPSHLLQAGTQAVGASIDKSIGVKRGAYGVQPTYITPWRPSKDIVLPKPTVWKPNDISDRRLNALNTLLTLKSDKTPCHVLTLAHPYIDMYIQKLELPQNEADGDVFTFNITFYQVDLIAAADFEFKTPAEVVAQPKKTAGAKSTEENKNAKALRERPEVSVALDPTVRPEAQ